MSKPPKDSKRIGSRLLSSMVAVDPESLPLGTQPDYTFWYIDISSVIDGRISIPDAPIEYREAPSRARRVVKSGDVLISTVRPNLKAFAYCHLPQGNFVASTGFAVLRAVDQNDSRYVLYALMSDAVSRQIDSLTVGSNYPAINTSDVRRLTIPEFAPDDQHRIAEILSMLDETIVHTEALIAKYQQIKAGLMYDLFTRGVTPDGRLRPARTQAPNLYKESPLGWIPKDWEVRSLGGLAQLITSGSRGWAEYYSENGPLFLRIGNLIREHINFRWDNVTRVSLPKFTEGQRTAVMPNDILISITADLGIIAVANELLGEAYVNQHIALVRMKPDGPSSRFLGHFMTTSPVQRQFHKLNDSGAKAGLNLPAIGKVMVVCPQDDSEATAIASIIDAYDESAESHRVELSKLCQLKHGLMHDLLTGRVRVKAAEPVSP